MRFMTSLLGGKAKNLQFGAALHGGFGPGEQLVGDRFGEIIFATVGTDLGWHIFENNGARMAL
jgi:hypothetical protein